MVTEQSIFKYGKWWENSWFDFNVYLWYYHIRFFFNYYFFIRLRLSEFRILCRIRLHLKKKDGTSFEHHCHAVSFSTRLNYVVKSACIF